MGIFKIRMRLGRAYGTVSACAKGLYTAIETALKNLWKAREQIYVLLRDTKWIIATSVVLALLLAVPDQIKELYRIVYSEGAPEAGTLLWIIIRLHLPIMMVGLVVCFGTYLIVSESRRVADDQQNSFLSCAKALPVLIGSLPLIGSGVGLYNAIPEPTLADIAAFANPTDSLRLYRDQINRVTEGLYIGVALAALTLVLFTIIAIVGRRYIRKHENQPDRRYWGRWRGIAVLLVTLFGLSAAFIAEPVRLPQSVEAFFVMMLFATCVVGFVVNFSLVSMEFRIPIISVFLVFAILFSIAGWTDNHHVRLNTPADPRIAAGWQPDAAKQFEEWLASRPDRDQYRDYPVYIVAAQGGGMYAAYQTATFLARMQDICPQFRQHLFAISSVSGGSLGAAIFSAALKAQDQQKLAIRTGTAMPTREHSARDPCPKIADHMFASTSTPQALTVGPLEAAVQSALGRDFFSPLLAAMLFPDFTQRFLPRPFGALDRARALEYTLEEAGRSFLSTPGRSLTAEDNALESSVLALWSATAATPIPALLINTTDAGSGRRFVIAPFKMAATTSSEELGALVDYQFWNNGAPRDLRLSTAAVISARFPWITPAATIEHGKTRVRLVDGGYIDNSGVETAIELKSHLDAIARADNSNAKINLIVLTGGEYPTRSTYALGDTLEPIRALLNTRTSRAYVAIERARRIFPDENHPVSFMNERVTLPSIRKARLDRRFYALPLGWAIANQTRAMITDQSGDFSHCTLDDVFDERKGRSFADCIQLLSYFEMSQSLPAAAERISVSRYLRSKQNQLNSVENSQIRSVIACYHDKISPPQTSKGIRPLPVEQAVTMQALLKTWRDSRDRNLDSLMAYMMATAAAETNRFATRSESLMYTSVADLRRTWRKTFEGMTDEEMQEKYVRNPEPLAEKVYGGRGGNDEAGDGWRYRGRGLAFVTLKKAYQEAGNVAGFPKLVERPELVFIPEINAKVFIESRFPQQRLPELHYLLTTQKFQELRRLVVSISDQPSREIERLDEITRQLPIFEKCITEAKLRG